MSDPEDTPGIPRAFWSEYLERPFETCVQCESDLLADDWTGYVIQKSVVAGETVFEMAICIDCARELQEEFSEQSRRSLTEFVRNAPERRRRESEKISDACFIPVTGQVHISREEYLEKHRREWQKRATSCCAICAKLERDCHRYSTGTACLALDIVTALPGTEDLGSPFLICEDCEMAMNECISTQTRDAWDRFVEDTFDGPPGLEVDPRELTLVF